MDNTSSLQLDLLLMSPNSEFKNQKGHCLLAQCPDFAKEDTEVLNTLLKDNQPLVIMSRTNVLPNTNSVNTKFNYF